MHLLLHIFVKLWRKLWRHIWYPLAMLWRRIFGIAVLVGFGYIVSLFFEEDELGAIPTPPNIAVPANPAQKNTTAPPPLKQGKDAVVQLVTKTENGNSAFATDLIDEMDGKELQFYSQTFYWVMQYQQLGKAHAWNYTNVHGTLTPVSQFKNKLGDTCRTFTEVLKVHEYQQHIKGIACEQRGGGWCKLRPNSTPACDLGRKPGLSNWWFDTKRSLNSLF